MAIEVAFIQAIPIIRLSNNLLMIIDCELSISFGDIGFELSINKTHLSTYVIERSLLMERSVTCKLTILGQF